MGFAGYKFSDKHVIRWAKIYRTNEMSLMEMERAFNVSHSTIRWGFQHRLANIDIGLYEDVQDSILIISSIRVVQIRRKNNAAVF